MTDVDTLPVSGGACLQSWEILLERCVHAHMCKHIYMYTPAYAASQMKQVWMMKALTKFGLSISKNIFPDSSSLKSVALFLDYFFFAS